MSELGNCTPDTCERCGNTSGIVTMTTLYVNKDNTLAAREVDHFCQRCLDAEVQYEVAHRGARVLANGSGGASIQVDYEDFYF